MHNQLQLFVVEDGFSSSSTFNFPPIKSDKSFRASISTYSPNGRQTKYYRLCYRLKTKVKCVHIRGGNIYSQLATRRAKRLQAMIDRGASIDELFAVIKSYCPSK